MSGVSLVAGWLAALPVRRTPARLRLVASGYRRGLSRSLPSGLDSVLGVLPFWLVCPWGQMAGLPCPLTGS